MITNIIVPCYCTDCNAEKPTGHKLVVNEFAGKLVLESHDSASIDNPIRLEVDFDDLQRAWNAVRRTI
jgi:hypothetical protein